MSANITSAVLDNLRAWQSEHGGTTISAGGESSSRLHHIPLHAQHSGFDLNYITDNVIAAAQPVSTESNTLRYTDQGRDSSDRGSQTAWAGGARRSDGGGEGAPIPGTRSEADSHGVPLQERDQVQATLNPLSPSDTHVTDEQQQEQHQQSQQHKVPQGNPSEALSASLEREHRDGALVIWLSDDPPDDKTLTLFRRQIVRLPWQSAAASASQVPTLATLLNIAYVMTSWLQQDESHVVMLVCENGKTRTGLAVAAYLKVAGHTATCADGFCHFCVQRCPRWIVTPEQVVEHLPASVKRVWENIDQCVELGIMNEAGYGGEGYGGGCLLMNRKPLLLRAIGVQGVPSPKNNKLCMELWNALGERIYSSHFPISRDASGEVASDNDDDDDDDKSGGGRQQLPNSHWAEDDGFYRVDTLLAGDFCLVCRRLPPESSLESDPEPIPAPLDSSHWIFRYADTTAFLSAGGFLELPLKRVDLMRPQHPHHPNAPLSRHIKEHEGDFLLSLVFEAAWNSTQIQFEEELWQECSQDIFPKILSGEDAFSEGWRLIIRHHAAKPEPEDLDDFIASVSVENTDIRRCPLEIRSLALQLANFNYEAAEVLLMDKFASWWKDEAVLPKVPTGNGNQPNEEKVAFEPSLSQHQIDECANIMQVIDGTDFFKNMPESEKTLGGLLEDSTLSVHASASAAMHSSHPRQPVAPRTLLNLPTILQPQQGDIFNSLGPPQGLSHIPWKNRESIPATGMKPLFPLISRVSAGRKGSVDLIDHPRNEAAVQLYLRMGNPKVGLSDLIRLKTRFRKLGSESAGGQDDSRTNQEKSASTPLQEPIVAAVEQDAEGGEETPEVALKDDVLFQKYFKMLKMGLPKEAVQHAMQRDDVDQSILELDPEKSLKSQRPCVESDAAAEVVDLPLRSDPVFEKYFKMLKMGLPKEAVQHAMQRDEVDQSILELDPEKSLKFQRPSVENDATTGDSDPPLKSDPVFEKYFKMLKMGLPKEAVQHAMQRDEADQSILELDPEKSLKSQRRSTSEDEKGQKLEDEVPLKSDPVFLKYFKMLKMGLPKEAVQHAMQRDEADQSLLDLDPERSLKSQRPSVNADATPEEPEVPLKSDPVFQKYYKMLKMGLPDEAVRHAMQRDEADQSLLDLDPEKSLKSQRPPVSDDANPQEPEVPLKSDPIFQKYYKMLKMGLPEDAVRHAMHRDDADESLLKLDPEKSLKSQRPANTDGTKPQEPEVPLKLDPIFQKYYKMLKMGLPEEAVRHAMQRDEADDTLLELDPEKSFRSQRGPSGTTKAGGISDTLDVPLSESPEWSKYFKMLKMGLPMEAVKHAVERDGKDPSVLELNPCKPISAQKVAMSVQAPATSTKKKKVRRKKIFWNAKESGQITEDSVWSIMKDKVNIGSLSYDIEEFEELFTQSADPADQKKSTKKKDDSKKKKLVQVIDGKRSMNGGIILLRLRMDYGVIAGMVDKMESGQLDATTLKALKEFLPAEDERTGLVAFMNAFKSEEEKEKGYLDLSECEKYMFKMISVSDASSKFDCMLFRSQFQSRFDELRESVEVVEHACIEVRSSERLREILAIILTIVNQINTGGDSKGAAGFTLDALLKLNEAKAFDKKTSVLKYLVKVVKRNDAALLEFDKDLGHIQEAETLVIDSLCNDIAALEEELVQVRKTAKYQAGLLPLKQPSVKDISEHVTAVRSIDSVPQYSQTDHISGRTPMEKFAYSAGKSIEEALAKTSEVKDMFKGLLRFFGEDEEMPSNEFFGTLVRFVEEFKAGAKEIKREEKAKRLEKLKSASKKATTQDAKGKKKPLGKPDRLAMSDIAKMAMTKAKEFSAAKEETSTEKDSTLTDKTSSPAETKKLQPAEETAATDTTSALTSTPAQSNLGCSGGPPDIAKMAAMKATAAAKTQSISLEQEPTPIGATTSEDSLTGGSNHSSKRGRQKAAGKSIANTSASELSEDLPKQIMPGIAGMADAAAAARFSPEKSNPPPPTGTTDSQLKPAISGGIAGMAAAAAAARFSPEKSNPPPPTGTTDSQLKPAISGGIAGMAAAAAAARFSPEKSNPPPPTGTTNSQLKPAISGGIAGMAAAAAAARFSPEKSNPPPSNGTTDSQLKPAISGGIAGMAAAAAAARFSPEKSNPPPPPGTTESQLKPAIPGGIAGMAAAAAAARFSPEKSDPSPPTGTANSQLKPAISGGIAGMAAAAAAARFSPEKSDPSPPTGTTESQLKPAIPGGIAGMAAAAAAARFSPEKSDPSPPTGTTESQLKPAIPGGIAGMAAAAAAARFSPEKLDPSPPTGTTNSQLKPAIPGGIAGMAAAAAAARFSPEKSNPPPSNGTTDSQLKPAISGGIAGMAAAAAAARFSPEKSNPPPPTGTTESQLKPAIPGGIAGMAAAAAAARFSPEKSDPSPPTGTTNSQLKPAISGGIAGMAAAAAAARFSPEKSDPSPPTGTTESQLKPAIPGGIAGMAAAAAAARFSPEKSNPPLSNGTTESQLKPAISGGIAGMAAAAAAAAAARFSPDQSDPSPPTGTTNSQLKPATSGGIAGMAAAAAAARFSPEKSNPPPNGSATNSQSKPAVSEGIAGIAAAPAAAARFPPEISKPPHTSNVVLPVDEPPKDRPKPAVSGIAAMAAAAAAARFSDETPEPPLVRKLSAQEKQMSWLSSLKSSISSAKEGGDSKE